MGVDCRCSDGFHPRHQKSAVINALNTREKRERCRCSDRCHPRHQKSEVFNALNTSKKGNWCFYWGADGAFLTMLIFRKWGGDKQKRAIFLIINLPICVNFRSCPFSQFFHKTMNLIMSSNHNFCK